MNKPITTSIETNVPPASSAPNDVIRPVSFAPGGTRNSRWRWSLKPVTLCLIIGLIVVLLAAGFIFSARSLVIKTTPDFATVDISGGLLLPLGSRYLLLSGEYSVAISAQGYYPVTKPLLIDETQNQRAEFVLNKTPGLLTINTQPSTNVQFVIDQQPYTAIPGSALELSAGEHTLKVSADRYISEQRVLTIEGSGQQQVITVELQPAWGSVTLTSSPDNAEVFLDGQLIGMTPLTHEVLQGQHTIEFQREGYSPFSQSLEVVAGNTYQPKIVQLEKVGAWIQLSTQPANANVTFNDNFKGQTPLKLFVRPGIEHRLAVFKTGYEKLTRRIELDSGEKTTLSLQLKPRLAKVRVRVFPSDAQLYVGGKLIGNGSQTLNLPAHQQEIEVRKTGYQTKQRKVIPRPGFEQSLSMRLLTEHEAKWENVKPKLVTAAGQELLLFHPSKFVMGASRREAGRRSNETLHAVNMSRAFYLAKKEVTNAEFRLFKNDHSSGHFEGESLDADQQPVVKITWEQAAAYCNWLSERDSLNTFYKIDKQKVVGINDKSNGYRLPTEAEWAWAARTVNNKPQLKFPWGATLPPKANSGNYADVDSARITGRAIAGYKDGYLVSAPVGSFSANQFKLFDMGGNVAEWMHDYYGLGGRTGKKTVTDPTGPTSGEYRVIRGSSWAHGTVTELRLSYRDYGRDSRNDLGFRLARYVE